MRASPIGADAGWKLPENDTNNESGVVMNGGKTDDSVSVGEHGDQSQTGTSVPMEEETTENSCGQKKDDPFSSFSSISQGNSATQSTTPTKEKVAARAEPVSPNLVTGSQNKTDSQSTFNASEVNQNTVKNTAKDGEQQHSQLSCTETEKIKLHSQATDSGEDGSNVSASNESSNHASWVRSTVTMAGCNMQTKKTNNYEILGENDDFYLTKEGSLWALLPKQHETSQAICIKPNENPQHASFVNGLLKLDSRLLNVKFVRKKEMLQYEEIVDENEDFYLKKRKENWSLLSKKSNKTEVLSKLKNADKVHFEGSVLKADGKIFYLKNYPGGEVFLDEHKSDVSDSDSDDISEIQADNKTDEKPKAGDKQSSNHNMNNKAAENEGQKEIGNPDAGTFISK